MQIISRIEIKHFRSFDGGKDQPKVHINDLKDINLFSGSNDSGKSNVLRALNLFFNNEISPGVPFDKDRDFSKIVAKRFDEDIFHRRIEEAERIRLINENGVNEKPRDLRRSDEVISIKLYFNNESRVRGLPESFWISRTYSQKNNFQGDYIYQSDLNKAQTTAFLKKLQFEYIPAIKDRSFFLHLFSKLQNYLFEKGDKSRSNKFRDSSRKFNDILRDETAELFKSFEKSSGVEANFHIPTTLIDFFRTLSVLTEDEVSLFERGDGIQARFIPEILDEISKNTNKIVIWGFEEPENSYESRNIRNLRNDFLDKYSRKYQIFITTHTMELLSMRKKSTADELQIINNKKISLTLKDTQLKSLPLSSRSSDIAIFRVWKKDRTSLITRFDENNNAWEELCDDLGIIQESRIIEDLQKRIEKQIDLIGNSELEKDKQRLVYDALVKKYDDCAGELSATREIIEEFTKPILKVEDYYDDIYMISYLKVKKIPFTKENLRMTFSQNAPFVIRRSDGAGAVRGFLGMNTLDGYESKKVIGLFDYDEEGSRNFYLLRDNGNREWSDGILGDRKTGFYRKRKKHDCFHALILPIPDRLAELTSDVRERKFISYIEIENLVSLDCIQRTNAFTEESVMDKRYWKIKIDKKSDAFRIFGDLPEECFEDFIPLFKKIEELFGVR